MHGDVRRVLVKQCKLTTRVLVARERRCDELRLLQIADERSSILNERHARTRRLLGVELAGGLHSTALRQ